ncbi:MAG: hypothetical protein HN348_33705, partial [Proteobacteria bacterium]|nr:hypothetical protein [Pseudomonadota bacterium]
MSEPRLPRWAEELRNRYLAGEASQFLVHGNVRDMQPWDVGDGAIQYLDMRGFLEKFLGRTRDIVAYYNVSQGLCFPDRSHEKRFQRTIDAQRMLDGREKLDMLPRTPSIAIPLVEELITNPNQASGVVLDFFEMIAPAGDVSFMTTE